MVEELRTKLKEASNHFQQLLQFTHDQALSQNELNIKRWESYKNEHEELSGRLLSLRDKLSHSVMVPIGKKALMRGSLSHTNEILVCLGDGWFAKQTAKQAADLCQRRIQHCDEMLNKLKKEKELLTSRKTFTVDNDAFGGEHQVEEVIEEYNEEEEKKWRERHREKEKEYRQKLAELRTSQRAQIETEEDLWKRLDALDLQEELEDELNRMNDTTEDDDEESDVESGDDSETASDDEADVEKPEDNIQIKSPSALKRRVSFKEDKENDDGEENLAEDRFIQIEFKHSDAPSITKSTDDSTITSPADIYLNYLKKRMPKSILKRSSSEQSPLSEEFSSTQCPFTKHTEEVPIQIMAEPVVKAVGEVVERTVATPAVSETERPVSRFKAARMANKR